MCYEYFFTKRFEKDLEKFNSHSKRLYQIETAIKKIIESPLNCNLDKEKIKGSEKFEIRYLIGKKHRILVEIKFKDKYIIFLRVGKRENFYS